MASGAFEELQFVGFTSYNAPILSGASASHPQPGDVILRIGSEGSSSSLEAPFSGGLRQVVNELQRRIRDHQEWVELLLARRTGTVAMLAPLSRFDKRKKLFEAKDVGMLADCQLKEGTPQMFADIGARQEREVWEAVSKQLADISIGEQELAEDPGTLPTMLSVMVYPTKDATGRSRDVAHTGARAMNWLRRAQASGVALNLLNLSSEVVPLPSRASGSTLEDKLRVHSADGKWAVGEDICCHRGVRLWLQPQDEVLFTLSAVTPNARTWSMVINRTDQGFLYIDSVDPLGEAAKCGLGELLRIVKEEGKLTIRAINGVDVTPKVLSNGKIVMAKMEDVLRMFMFHLHLSRPLAFDFIVSDKIGQLARQVQQVGAPVTYVAGTAV